MKSTRSSAIVLSFPRVLRARTGREPRTHRRRSSGPTRGTTPPAASRSAESGRWMVRGAGGCSRSVRCLWEWIGESEPMPRALLLENIDPVATDVLSSAGFEVDSRKGALDEGDLAVALDGVDLLGIRSKTHVTAEVLRRHPRLAAVGAFCIGTNQIDLAAADAAGVAVFNAPYSNTRSVVEMAIAEIIIMARRLVDRDRALHAGTWDKSAAGSHEVRGRTLGIVGYGNIGSQLSVLAEALGMRVVFYDL